MIFYETEEEHRGMLCDDRFDYKRPNDRRTNRESQSGPITAERSSEVRRKKELGQNRSTRLQDLVQSSH